MFTARELHIHLVVNDIDAITGLHLAAAELKQRALQARDRYVEFACVQAHDRVLAIAAAYTRLQALSLERPAETVQVLPGLRRDLCACLDYPRPALAPPSVRDPDFFPALTALSNSGVVSDIVEDSVRRAKDELDCAVSFSLERDAAGDWVIATSAEPTRPDVDAANAVAGRLLALAHAVTAWARRLGERAGLAATASG